MATRGPKGPARLVVVDFLRWLHPFLLKLWEETRLHGLLVMWTCLVSEMDGHRAGVVMVIATMRVRPWRTVFEIVESFSSYTLTRHTFQTATMSTPTPPPVHP